MWSWYCFMFYYPNKQDVVTDRRQGTRTGKDTKIRTMAPTKMLPPRGRASFGEETAGFWPFEWTGVRVADAGEAGSEQESKESHRQVRGEQERGVKAFRVLCQPRAGWGGSRDQERGLPKTRDNSTAGHLGWADPGRRKWWACLTLLGSRVTRGQGRSLQDRGHATSLGTQLARGETRSQRL